MSEILCLENIRAGYLSKEVLHDVSLKLKENTTLVLVGPNGAGKSTILKVIAGILRPWKGKVSFGDKELDGVSVAQRARMGISYFLQGGEVFRNMSVIENLQVAGRGLSRRELEEEIEIVFSFFPKLKTMISKRAGLLSGGEKHELALGIILIRRPKLMLLDEPSAGLSPLLVKELLQSIRKIKETLSTSVLLVEQNVSEGLKIADSVLLMKAGAIVNEASPQEVMDQNLLEQLFFENL